MWGKRRSLKSSTEFIYVEFRDPYESFKDIGIDLVIQYDENLKKLGEDWMETIKKILLSLGISVAEKWTGSDILTNSNAVEMLSKTRPTLLLKRLEENTARICEKRG